MSAGSVTKPRWGFEDLNRLFKFACTEGKTTLITGFRGVGKTTLAVTIALWALLSGYHVLSNILMKKVDHIDESIQVLRSDGTTAGRRICVEEAYPKNYHKVTSFAEYCTAAANELSKDPDAKMLLVLDEGAFIIGSTDSVFSAPINLFLKFMTIARKFNTAVTILSVSSEMIQKKLRSAEGGFLNATFRKDEAYTFKYARNLSGDVDPRNIFIFEIEDKGVMEVFHVSPIGLPYAQPIEYAEPGDIVFDTKAPATFTIGTYPGSSLKFDFKGMIDYVGRGISEESPQRMIDFLKYHGKVGEIEDGGSDYAVGIEEAESLDSEILDLKVGSKRRKAIMKHLTKQIAKEMIEAGSWRSKNYASKEIAEQLSEEISERVPAKTVYAYLKELEDAGEL